MRGLRAAPEYLLFTIALAWPLGLFQYAPVLNLTVTGSLGALLFGLAVFDFLQKKKLRVPFEALWPVGLLILLLAAIAYRGTPGLATEVPGALILFVATAHFASSRASIERWLRASMFSGSAVALLSLAAPAAGLMPTAYSLHLPTTFTFAYDLHSGAHILALCFILALFTAAKPSEHHVVRTIATGCALLLGGTLAAKGLQLALSDPRFSGAAYLSFPPLSLTAFLIALWLFVRIVAKLEVDRRERPGSLHLVFWAMAVASLPLIAAGPFQPRLYHGYLLGLACGYALSEREPRPLIAWPKAATAWLAALLLINPWVVFPQNESDPRNYEVAAAQDFLQKDFNTLLRRLEFIEAHSQDELRTHLWRARVALELGEPNGAAMEFALSVRPEDHVRRLLPGPTTDEKADFVVQLRDLASTMPENQSVCAYERALLALGNRDAAVFSLQLLTNIALVHAEGVENGPIADAVAFILGQESLRAEFAAWTTDELLTLLSQWGANIDAAPEDFPPEALPAIFVLQRRLSSVEILVSLGPSRHSFREPIADRPFRARYLNHEPSDIVWGPATRTEEQILRVPVSLPRPEGLVDAGFLEIAEGGSIANALSLRFRWTLDQHQPVPFTPAIRIYLP
ncbi:MAG: hypothetical protein QGD90_08690 [Candidatus Hydrogenedentes bacterium]|nr:hypothetical protein [Candidatus Hydrogenedentota bacterium]